VLGLFCSGLRAQEKATADVTATGGDEVDDSWMDELVPIDGIVAKVNDEIITAAQVYRRIRAALDRLYRQYRGKEFERKAFQLWESELMKMIDEKLLLQAAREVDIEVDKERIERELRREIERFGSREAYVRYLWETYRLTLAEAREMIRNRLLIREYVLRRVYGSKRPGEEGRLYDSFVRPCELREYYQKHKQEFYEPAQYLIRQIILDPHLQGGVESVKNLGRALLRQIKEGADFGLLARYYSVARRDEDGLWEWRTKEAFLQESEELANLIAQMKVGQVSGLLRTGKVFRIVKLEEKKEGRQKSFQEVQDWIKYRIRSEKAALNQNRVLTELRKKAYVEIIRR
jgi:parvulin-like peptidyl-prolyl isomerase